MYVTKEQVEAMIAQALANGPAAPGESTTDRQINSLADTVKAIADTAQEAVAGLSALRREVSDQSRRIDTVEKDIGSPRPATPVEPGPMEIADDPGAVVAHASAPEAAPQPTASAT